MVSTDTALLVVASYSYEINSKCMVLVRVSKALKVCMSS